MKNQQTKKLANSCLFFWIQSYLVSPVFCKCCFRCCYRSSLEKLAFYNYWTSVINTFSKHHISNELCVSQWLLHNDRLRGKTISSSRSSLDSIIRCKKIPTFLRFFSQIQSLQLFKQKKQLFKILPKSNFLKPCQWNCCKVMRHSSRTGSGMTRFSLVNSNFSFLFKKVNQCCVIFCTNTLLKIKRDIFISTK